MVCRSNSTGGGRFNLFVAEMLCFHLIILNNNNNKFYLRKSDISVANFVFVDC